MKLSERLAIAAAERADAAAAGTSVEDWRRRRAAAVEPPSSADDVGLAAPPSTALRVALLVAPQTPVVAVDPDPQADPRSICPTCGRGGELGMVDLLGRTADWSCTACGTMWRVALPPAPADENAPPR